MGAEPMSDDKCERLQPLAEGVPVAEMEVGARIADATMDLLPALHIRCPHCHRPIEIIDERPLTELICPSCHSKFTLATSETLDGAGGATGAVPRPKMLGHFELLGQLGTGAFGTVWKARDTKLDRIVAVKIPRRVNLHPDEVEKFLREARTAAQLQHPNIVSVHEVGLENGVIYIVSDFIDGLPLKDWMAQERPSHRRSVELCVTIAEALHYAHETGIVHRDLKPGNVMMDASGQPHVMDFGLAKREAGEITITVEGQILGTPAYMPPEQARGEGYAADRRSDVYSLGVILFELLTGERPFRGDVQMLLKQVVEDEPPPARKFDASISRDLETICAKCLEKDPRRRYATAAELGDDLRHSLADEPIHARPVGKPERFWRWCRRQPMLAGLSAVLGAVLLFLAFAGPLVAWKQSALRRLANQETENAERARADAQANYGRAEQRLHDLRHSLYNMQLSQVSACWERDPGQAEDLLRDTERCPADLRDFTWGFFDRLCKRDRRRWKSHAAEVRAVSFSADGKLLATVGGEGAAKVWEIDSGKQRILPGVPPRVSCGQMSPKDDLLALATAEGRIYLLDLGDGRIAGTWSGSTGPVSALSFSPDGSRLAAGGEARKVEVRDVATGVLIETLADFSQPVSALAFSPDGTKLAVGTGGPLVDGPADLVVCQLSRGGELFRATKLPCGVSGIGFVGDSETLVFADMMGSLASIHWPDKKIRGIHSHGGMVHAIAVSPDGKRLASAAISGHSRAGIYRAHQPVLIWNTATWEEASYPLGLQGAATAVAFGPSNRILATGSDDGTVALWVVGPEREDAILKHPAPVKTVRFEPDGNTLVVHADREYVWNLGGIGTGNANATAASRPRSEAGAPAPSGTTSSSSVQPTKVQALIGDKPHLFSPDRKTLALPHEEEVIELQDLTSGQATGSFPGEDVVVSPDHRAFALSSTANAVVLTDVADPKRRVTLEDADGHYLRHLRFTPDGESLVGQSGARTLRCWDAATGRVRRSLDMPNDMTQFVLSPDGKTVAVGERTNASGRDVPPAQIRLWRLQDGNVVAFAGHAHTVANLAFSSDGRLLASTGEDSSVRWFDAATGTEKGSVTGLARENGFVAFSRDGGMILFAGKENDIRRWNILSGKAEASLTGQANTRGRLKASPDGKTFVTASEKDVILWDAESGKQRGRLSGYHFRHTLFDLEYAPDGTVLAMSGPVHDITLWDVSTARLLRTLHGELARFLPDGKTLAVTQRKAAVKLVDVASGAPCGELEGATPEFSPDSTKIATVSFLHSVSVWDRSTRKELVRFPPSGAYVLRMQFAPDGKTFLTQEGTSVIRIWDLESGVLRSRLPIPYEEILASDFSPDGRILALGGFAAIDGSSPDDRFLRLGGFAAIDGSSPDDRFLRLGGFADRLGRPVDVFLVDLATGTLRPPLRGHTGDIYALTFSPDGRTLASGSFDFTVRLWDPLTGQERECLTGHQGTVFSIAFSPNGKVLASASHDGTVRLWSAQPADQFIVPTAPKGAEVRWAASDGGSEADNDAPSPSKVPADRSKELADVLHRFGELQTARAKAGQSQSCGTGKETENLRQVSERIVELERDKSSPGFAAASLELLRFYAQTLPTSGPKSQELVVVKLKILLAGKRKTALSQAELAAILSIVRSLERGGNRQAAAEAYQALADALNLDQNRQWSGAKRAFPELASRLTQGDHQIKSAEAAAGKQETPLALVRPPMQVLCDEPGDTDVVAELLKADSAGLPLQRKLVLSAAKDGQGDRFVRVVRAGPVARLCARIEFPFLDNDGANTATRFGFVLSNARVAFVEIARRRQTGKTGATVRLLLAAESGPEEVARTFDLPEGVSDGDWEIEYNHGMLLVQCNRVVIACGALNLNPPTLPLHGFVVLQQSGETALARLALMAVRRPSGDKPDELCDTTEAVQLTAEALKFYRAQKLQAAAESAAAAVEAWKKARGEDHLDVANALFNLATVQADQKQHAAALENYAASLAIRQRILGDGHLLTAMLHMAMAASHAAENRMHEVRTHLEAAYPVFESVLGGDDERTKSACALLEQLSGGWPAKPAAEAREDMGVPPQQLELRRYRYIARLNQAQLALRDLDFDRAQELLDAERPQTGEPDLRSFEWYYLWRICHPGKSTFHAHDDWVLATAFSPDGQVLATGGRDGLVKLWDTRTWEQRAVLKPHQGKVNWLAFLPDGKTLAAGSCADKEEVAEVKLWDVAKGQQLARLESPFVAGYGPRSFSAAISPDGKTLVTASVKKSESSDSGPFVSSVLLWDLAKQQVSHEWAVGPGAVTCLAIDRAGARIAAGNWDGTVQVLDFTTGKPITKLARHSSGLLAVQFSLDGRTLATAAGMAYSNAPGEIRLWDAPVEVPTPADGSTKVQPKPGLEPEQTWKCRSELTAPAHFALSLAFSPDGNTLASGGWGWENNTVYLWDAATGQPWTILPDAGGPWESVSFDAQGKWLAAGGRHGQVKVWDINDLEEPVRLAELADSNSRVAFLGEGKRLLSWGRDGKVRMWDRETRKELPAPQVGPFDILALTPDGKTLATATADGAIGLWELPAGKPRQPGKASQPRTQAMKFSPDGKILALVTEDRVSLWDLAEWKERAALPVGGGALAFSPDGNTVVTARDSKLQFWDCVSGKARVAADLQGITMTVVAFAPDGKCLAVGSMQGLVPLLALDWDGPRLGIQVRNILRGHRGSITALAFTADGRVLASGGSMLSGRAEIKLWDTTNGEQRADLSGADGDVQDLEFSPDGETMAVVRGNRRGQSSLIELWNGSRPK